MSTFCTCYTDVLNYLVSGWLIRYTYYVGGCKTEGSWVDSQNGRVSAFLLNIPTYSLASQPPFQWVTSIVPPEKRRWRLKPISLIAQVPRLRIRGTTPPLSTYASLTRAWNFQKYFFQEIIVNKVLFEVWNMMWRRVYLCVSYNPKIISEDSGFSDVTIYLNEFGRLEIWTVGTEMNGIFSGRSQLLRNKEAAACIWIFTSS
jgi:hypothetical protein